MFKKIIITFLIIFTCSKIIAQDFKVNVNKLTEETQQLSDSPDKMRLVWWIPTDFWQAVFDQDKAIPRQEADLMLSQFEKYTMIATIDGTIDADGNINYFSKETIFNNLIVTDANKNEFTPLLDDEIDLDIKRLITVFKPVLANMLGKLGENMHFFLFQKRDNPMDKIVNPKNTENFAVKLNDEQFVWNLPLGSLLKPKKCPVDNKSMDGSWSYCPFHGKRLIKQ